MTRITWTPALVEVYGLFDPVTGACRYVGKSTNSVVRFHQHLRDALDPNHKRTRLHGWIKQLIDAGKAPRLKVLQRCGIQDWDVVERRCIAEQREAGCKLLNISPGGKRSRW